MDPSNPGRRLAVAFAIQARPDSYLFSDQRLSGMICLAASASDTQKTPTELK
jgi:hypothetical protein